MQHSEPDPQIGDDFEAPAPLPNGAATSGDLRSTKPGPTPLFGGVSARTAAAAKTGNLSSSRTGKSKQASHHFDKPKADLYVKVHPGAGYSMVNVPVWEDKHSTNLTYHYIKPELFESGQLPDRFLRAVKLIDIYVMGGADGTFFMWAVKVGTHSSRKGALAAIEIARSRYVLIEWFGPASTYNVEPATEAIPEPEWASLPTFEKMLLDGFASIVSVPDDKIVLDFMSGGVANRKENQEDGE